MPPRNDDYILIRDDRKHVTRPYHHKSLAMLEHVYNALLSHGWFCMYGSEFVDCLKVSYEASLKADGIPVD